MSNREYRSDAQRGFDKNFKHKNNTLPSETIIVNTPSNNKSYSTSQGLSFCPDCGAMVLPNGVFICGCRDSSENESKLNTQFMNTSPEKTFLKLDLDRKKYKKGSFVKISGYLTLKNDYPLKNADIYIYISEEYLDCISTNYDGYFETIIIVSTIGRNPVKACFKGNSEYETSSDIKYIEIYDSNQNIQKNRRTNEIISDLERLGELYKNGILTKDEFIKLKKRLI